MWIHRSHVLAPLTKLQGKGVKFKWGKEQQTAFDNIKKIIAKEVLLSYQVSPNAYFMGAGNLTALYATKIKYAFRQLYRNAWYNGTTRTYVISVRPIPKRQSNSTYGGPNYANT